MSSADCATEDRARGAQMICYVKLLCTAAQATAPRPHEFDGRGCASLIHPVEGVRGSDLPNPLNPLPNPPNPRDRDPVRVKAIMHMWPWSWNAWNSDKVRCEERSRNSHDAWQRPPTHDSCQQLLTQATQLPARPALAEQSLHALPPLHAAAAQPPRVSPRPQ